MWLRPSGVSSLDIIGLGDLVFDWVSARLGFFYVKNAVDTIDVFLGGGIYRHSVNAGSMIFSGHIVGARIAATSPSKLGLDLLGGAVHL